MRFHQKVMIPALLLTLCGSIAFAEPDVPKTDGNIFPDPKLENPSLWNLPDGYRLLEREGKDGVNALFYERTDAQNYIFGGIDLDRLQPDKYYEFGAWVKVEKNGPAPGRGALCVEFFNPGYHSGRYLDPGKFVSGQWTLISGGFTIPPGTVKTTFRPYMPKNCAGKVWFSGFFVTSRVENLFFCLLEPHMPQALRAGAGELVIGIASSNLSMPRSCRVELRGPDGKVKILPGEIVERRITISVNLTPGEYQLSVSADVGGKNWSQKFLLRVNPADNAVPVNSCIIDSRGRAWVNGKKFLPIGLYLNQEDSRLPANKPFRHIEDELAVIAPSPFNCIMSYDILNPDWKRKNTSLSGIAATREMLDAWHRAGKKVIFSVKDVNPETNWQGVGGEREVITKVVSEFRDHPALLAWYISDETPPEKRAALLARRELINRLDPWHPTWAVYCIPGLTSHYIGTCDVFGIDPYPIETDQSTSIAAVAEFLDHVNLALSTSNGTALWAVPQIFNWTTYQTQGKQKRYRDPSEREILAITLLEAIMGAKGFIMFSYSDLHKGLVRDQFARRWAEVCRVAARMNSLAPFLLGDRPGPELQLRVTSGVVKAKAFTADDGRVAVLLTAVGPGKAAAAFQLPAGLKSQLGNTIRQADGSWLFTADNIDCDILYGE